MQSEQVDPQSNPDLKEVFDCGYAWRGAEAAGAPARYYAPNLWPDAPAGFREEVEGYGVEFRSAFRKRQRGQRRLAGNR